MRIQRPVNETIRRIRKRDWAIASVALAVAVAALVIGRVYGTFHGKELHPKVIAGASAGVVLVFGIIAVSRFSATLSRWMETRSSRGAEGAVKFLTTAAGYLFVVFAVLAVLQVGVGHLLVGAGVVGVVLGIAGQQSLGNVFAGLVLLMAHPFEVGDDIRVRSGSLGGILDGQVAEMSLTYLTLKMDDGNLKIPNSVMLAAGVMQRLPSNVEPPAPSPPSVPAQPPAVTASDRGGAVGSGAPPGSP